MSSAKDPAPGRPTTALDLTVAGVQLAFRAAPGTDLEAPGFEYPAFLRAGSARRRIAVDVRRAAPRPPPTDARLVFDTGDGWQLFTLGARRWLRMPRRDGDGAAAWQVTWAEPLRRARLDASPQFVAGGRLRHVLQYPLDQVLLTHALLDDGGLLLHAAGAVDRGRGIAFAGVSGAGKSTLTRMLRCDAARRFLSDDRVVVAAHGAGHRLHGTPWAGDARVADPRSAPLANLCFLRLAGAPGLRRLAPREALDRLLPVATLPWFDAARIGRALDVAGNLVARVACHELAFTRDAEDTAALLDALRDAPPAAA